MMIGRRQISSAVVSYARAAPHLHLPISLLLVTATPNLDRDATASVVVSEAVLNVWVNVELSGSSSVVRQADVSAVGSTAVSVEEVSDDGARAASSTGEAILTGTPGGTASFRGSFDKSPGPSQAGFTSTSGSLTYRFETDAPTTLFVESANAAILSAGADLGTNGPRLALNGNSLWTGSALNATRALERELAPGSYELTLFSSSQGAAWAARSEVSGELFTVFNWGVGGLPGTLENPILPTEIAPGDFGFDIVTTDTVRFYDPVIATGYDYVASNTPFASVLIPDALPGGDTQFQLLIGSDVFALTAGEIFDFTAVASNGVSEFGIRGIDPAEQLDPNDPTAFITGLSFVEGGIASSFRMTAVTSESNLVPEASSGMAWAALMAMGFLRTRTLRR